MLLLTSAIVQAETARWVVLGVGMCFLFVLIFDASFDCKERIKVNRYKKVKDHTKNPESEVFLGDPAVTVMFPPCPAHYMQAQGNACEAVYPSA